jgi:RNA polymerase sigma-70 factor (ECF subfamily)
MPTAKNILDQILEKEFKNQVRKIIVHFLKGNKQDQIDMQIIFWQYYKNLSQKETAEKMNMPLGTIKSRTHRAKQKIKEFIERVDKHAKL